MSNKKILFVCTHNAARSQMAEALYKLTGRHACSAGIQPSVINPYVVKVMHEIGIDISANRSKNISEFEGSDFDYVITLCDSANQNCPVFNLNTKKVHKSFPEPSSCIGTDEEILEFCRKVRDEIKIWLKKNFESEDKKIEGCDAN